MPPTRTSNRLTELPGLTPTAPRDTQRHILSRNSTTEATARSPQRKMSLTNRTLVFLLGFLLIPAMAAADSILDPNGVVIINGNTVVPANTPVHLPAGSVTHIFFYDGLAVVAVTTPPVPVGANNQPNPNLPRIQLPPPPPPPGGGPVPPGPVIQIPQPEHVKSVVTVNGNVTVTYDDGSTATVPGTFLSPGTSPAPGVPTSFDLDPGTGTPGLTPTQARDLFTTFVNDPDLTADLGYSLNLSDFVYDFGGKANFPLWAGPLSFVYPDGTTEQAFLNPVPEPSTWLTLFSGCIGVWVVAWRQRRTRTL